MNPLIDFLLSGVTRLPTEKRADALCSMVAGLLPGMSEADIGAARMHVVARFWSSPEIADPVVDLMDGHVALRSLLLELETDA